MYRLPKIKIRQCEMGGGRPGLEVVTWVFWVLVLTCNLGPFSMGIGMGFTSPAVPRMEHDGTLNFYQGNMFLSILSLSRLAGAFIGGFLLEKEGRKGTINLLAVPCVLGWFLILLASSLKATHFEEDGNEDIRFFCILLGRCLTGIGFGFSHVAVPNYLSEVSPAHLRGMVGVFYRIAMSLGFVYAYAFGASPLTWEWQAVFAALPPAILGVGMLKLPESPRWLLMKGLTPSAAQTIRTLTNNSEDEIEEELEEIEKGLSSSSNSFLDTLQTPRFYLPLFLIIGLQVLMQFTGINAILFNAESVFKRSGIEADELAAFYLGLCQLAATVVSFFLIDRLGRRFLLMASALGMCVSMGVAGASEAATHRAPQLTLVAFLCYAAFFAVGFGPLPNLIMSEVFTPETRGYGSSISILASNLSRFVILKSFDALRFSVHSYGCYWMYAAFCFVGFIFTWFFVPETKNVQLEEIALLFGEKRKEKEKREETWSG